MTWRNINPCVFCLHDTLPKQRHLSELQYFKGRRIDHSLIIDHQRDHDPTSIVNWTLLNHVCRWIESQIPIASVEEHEPSDQDKESTVTIDSSDQDLVYVSKGLDG
jgi:hypothetical protein